MLIVSNQEKNLVFKDDILSMKKEITSLNVIHCPANRFTLDLLFEILFQKRMHAKFVE